MKKVKLADVLWVAANKKLWNGKGDYFSAPMGVWRYSCDAVQNADRDAWTEATRKFLRKLGCNTESTALFEDFEHGRQRQGVRYMWLLLAMHVAEDEGIEIKVTA